MYSFITKVFFITYNVIARARVKFGIYPKISLLPVLSQIDTIASFFKVKISDFQTRFHDEYALLTLARHAVKVENRSRLIFFCA